MLGLPFIKRSSTDEVKGLTHIAALLQSLGQVFVNNLPEALQARLLCQRASNSVVAVCTYVCSDVSYVRLFLSVSFNTYKQPLSLNTSVRAGGSCGRAGRICLGAWSTLAGR